MFLLLLGQRGENEFYYGRVYQVGKSGLKLPIPSAGIQLIETSYKAISDSLGFFKINKVKLSSKIAVVS